MAVSDPTRVSPPRPAARPERNRRTAAILMAWIVLLMLVAVAVAWLRN